MILLLLLQAATQAPDIELNLDLRARSVRIEQKGEARLDLHADTPGNRVEVSVEPMAEGRTELRNVRVQVRAEARVADPAQIKVEAETGTPE